MASVARQRLDGDSRSQRRAKCEAGTANIDNHAMAGINDADRGTFAKPEGAKATGFIRAASDVDDCGPGPLAARGKRAGAYR